MAKKSSKNNTNNKIKPKKNTTLKGKNATKKSDSGLNEQLKKKLIEKLLEKI